jgi:hypothetical protein
MPAGRPLKYKTAKDLQSKIDKYKKHRDGKNLPYTKQSLILYLGFCDLHALEDSYTNKDEFSPTIKKIYTEIESSKIDSMYGDNPNTTFTIFDLKCNSGWNDRKAEQNDNDIDVVDFDFVEVK